MRSIESILLSIGLAAFSANVSQARAGDFYSPAENAGGLGQRLGAARPAVATAGEIHRNAYGKPCLAFDASSRALLADKNIFNYVVAVNNQCPRSIKLRICQKDGTGCSSAIVQAYQSQDMVMGFGPFSDLFEYTAKENP